MSGIEIFSIVFIALGVSLLLGGIAAMGGRLWDAPPPKDDTSR